jgi:3-hydroxyisobutyrate dehydrogenase-like beta-hydroxyacid dehydrogenase
MSQARARVTSAAGLPVCGGKGGADNATMVIMCGGEKVSMDSVLTYLEMLGKEVTYMAQRLRSMSKVATTAGGIS